MMNKEESYKELFKIAQSVITNEAKPISNMANLCALIKEKFDHLWIGFYLVDDEERKLYLGPFQGPLACTEIPFGRGVCGKSWEEKKLLNIPDVHQFPGHIACSSLSNSEIVIPILKDGDVIAVLDIDSVEQSSFDKIDEVNLQKICQLL